MLDVVADVGGRFALPNRSSFEVAYVQESPCCVGCCSQCFPGELYAATGFAVASWR